MSPVDETLRQEFEEEVKKARGYLFPAPILVQSYLLLWAWARIWELEEAGKMTVGLPDGAAGIWCTRCGTNEAGIRELQRILPGGDRIPKRVGPGVREGEG